MAALGQQPAPPKQQSSQDQPITQLEFHQAMQDFKTMFPEMDEDVIEVVLRANNGAVDATIDQLLAMSTDNENEKLRAELDATENAEVPPRYSPATPPPSYHQAVPYAQSPSHSPSVNQASPQTMSPSLRRPQTPQQPHRSPVLLPPFGSSATASSNTLTPSPLPLVTPVSTLTRNSRTENTKPALRVVNKWEPPLLGPLPPTFLRIDEGKKEHRKLTHRKIEKVTVLSSAMLQQRMEENERQRQISGRDDPELAQYLEDERIAIFLQNEEFVQELRRNKEFMTTLERDSISQPRVLPAGQTEASIPETNESRDDDEDDAPVAGLDAFPYTKTLPHSEDTDAAFREKLKNMGKVSRRKFAQLARLFSRRKRRNFRQILGEGANPSRDNLLLHEDEYSELSEEEHEADLSKDDTWNSHLDFKVKNGNSLDHHRPLDREKL